MWPLRHHHREPRRRTPEPKPSHFRHGSCVRIPAPLAYKDLSLRTTSHGASSIQLPLRPYLQALDRLVPVSSRPYGPYTSGLSTRSSTWGLTRLPGGRPHLGVGFALRCFQRLSHPHIATRRLPLAGQPVHQRCVHSGPLVLGAAPLKPPAPAVDRDRTVSRRSEPSSRTALMGEQPNPWELLHPQDAMSRHRGAKPPRRCGLLGEISLLSPG